MPPSDRIREYVQAVCGHIRWKPARTRVSQELTDHLLDARDACAAQGLKDDAAAAQAVRESGDAAELGASLDKLHRPRPQWLLLGVTLALVGSGFWLMLFLGKADLLPGRLLWAGAGIACMLALYLCGSGLLDRFPKTVYFAVLACALAAIPLSPVLSGQYYYAQYATLLFPLGLAALVRAARGRGYRGLLVCMLAAAPQILLAFRVPSALGLLLAAGGGLAILSAALYTNWFGIRRRRGGFLLLYTAAAAPPALFVLRRLPLPWNRILAPLNPYAAPDAYGYWGVMTRELLRGAQWFGPGSIAPPYAVHVADKTGALTANFYNDMLLTTVILKLGWAAFAAVAGVLLFFLLRGLMLCLRQRGGGRFVSLAIWLSLAGQAAAYVLYNLGVPLLTPISLPFVSHGNAALFVNLALAGLLLSVFRSGGAAVVTAAPAARTAGNPSA